MELITGGKSLAEMRIQRGIFQGDAQSRLLLVTTYSGYAQSHTNFVNRKKRSITCLQKRKKIWKLSFMHREYIQSRHRDGYGMEKYTIQVMNSGKRHSTAGMELPNQDKIRMLSEKKTYTYLDILEVDTIKQVEIFKK